ncbi:MAG: FecR domain-containing protein [bacterium]|nr:FecR domain-containing protein [bacterium]
MIKFLMLLNLMYSGSEFARVGDLRGEAKIWRYGEEGSEWLTINNIIGEGDELLTYDDSYLEIEFSDGSVLTLSSNTSVYFDRIEDDRSYFTLNKGTVRMYARNRVFGVFAGDRAVYVEEGSIVRVEVDDDYFSARVYKGVAEVDKRKVYAGFEVVVDRGRFYSGRARKYDGFDRWAEERERNYYVIQTVEYIPVPCYIGVYHFHRYGKWVYIRPYGWVWIPRVPRGWRPYYHGHWVYRPDLGWVWVSYEPWGWIPYRYGRWTYVFGYGWIWIPGETFAGAWVEWYYGPDWVGWAPIDYYGRPIIVVNNITIVNVVRKEEFHKPVYRYKPPKSGVYKEVYKPYKAIEVKEIVKYKTTELEKPVYFKKAEVLKKDERPESRKKDELLKDKKVEEKDGKDGGFYPERPVVEKKSDTNLKRERVEKEVEIKEKKGFVPRSEEKTVERESGASVLPERPSKKADNKGVETEVFPERPSYKDSKSKLLERENSNMLNKEESVYKKRDIYEKGGTKERGRTSSFTEKEFSKEERPERKEWKTFEREDKVVEKVKGRTNASETKEKSSQNNPQVKKKVEKKSKEIDNNKTNKGEAEK